MKNSKYRLLMFFPLVFLLFSCHLFKRGISSREIRELELAEIVFTRYHEGTWLLNADGSIIKSSYTSSGRLMYSKTYSVLIVNGLIETGSLYYSSLSDSVKVGKNFDLCGYGVSFINDSNDIIYITHKSDYLLQHLEDDPLLLIHYGSETGYEVLTVLELDRAIDHRLDLCVLGTNNVSGGKLYYKDVSSEDRHSMVLVYDFITNESEKLFDFDKLVIAPSISPNGEYLGFTSEDGFYIYDFRTKEITKLITIHWVDELIDEGYNYRKDKNGAISKISRYVPVISWSPDSTKFIFHLTDFSGSSESFSIYLYDFNTGEYTEIINNGYYPYWITN